ncbi:MAG: serine hydrolase [Lachnospiraceae bacterium]|nr:serine hydrolase [Lachnospiraceae bacterium]
MRNKIKVLIVMSALFTAICFTGCGKQDKYGINNYSVVYSNNGIVEYQNSGAGTDVQTVYELGSNGKTVAAYVALRMVDEGMLDLEDKIYPYLDENLRTDDPRLQEITLKELLCHTAGFSPSYELGIDKKIYSDPGTEFRYSGVGYIYLQNVIENAGGVTMDQAASKYVFEPMGMKNSTFESARTITPYMNLSNAVLYSMLIFIISFILLLGIVSIIGKITKHKLYSFKTGFAGSFIASGVINAVFLLFFFVSKVFLLFLAVFAAAGLVLILTRKTKRLYYVGAPVVLAMTLILGFTLPVSVPVTNDLIAKKANCAYSFKSTPEDMALFCDSLLASYNDPDDIYKMMFDPAVVIDEKNMWGLGIAIETDAEGDVTYWHSGINPGFQSLYVLYPAENKYIVVLTNSDNGLDYAADAARTFLGFEGQWQIKRKE